MDGVEIPSSGNVIMDGVSVDLVIMDGIEVWRAFDALWSGSSIGIAGNAFEHGLDTSGSQHRIWYFTPTVGSGYGGWLTANSSGLGVGTSSFITGGGFPSEATHTCTATTITPSLSAAIGVTATFAIGTGFTGGGSFGGSPYLQLETSGGQIRAIMNDGAGAWITLT